MLSMRLPTSIAMELSDKKQNFNSCQKISMKSTCEKNF